MRVVESVIGRKAALYSYQPPGSRRFEQSCLFALQDRTSRSALFLFDILCIWMLCAALPASYHWEGNGMAVILWIWDTLRRLSRLGRRMDHEGANQQ